MKNTALAGIDHVISHFTNWLHPLLDDRDKFLEEIEKSRDEDIAKWGRARTCRDFYRNAEIRELQHLIDILEGIRQDYNNLSVSFRDISESRYWNTEYRKNPSMK